MAAKKKGAKKKTAASRAARQAYEKLLELHTLHVNAEFLGLYGAHGVGVHGPRGRRPPGFTFYVTRIVRGAVLGAPLPIPALLPLEDPETSRTVQVPTEVVVTPPFTFDFDPTMLQIPTPGGVKITTIGSGTFGGWVWSDDADSLALLSAGHVLLSAKLPVTQPSSSGQKLGTVVKIVPLSKTATNYVDCGIARPSDTAEPDFRVVDVSPGVFALKDAADKLTVEKYGKETEYTRGVIDNAAWTGEVAGYLFKDCILVKSSSSTTAWADEGDSGALVFHDTEVSELGIKPVVGLHFASSKFDDEDAAPSGYLGIACKIQNVFDELGLKTVCAGVVQHFLDMLFTGSIELEEVDPDVDPDPGPGDPAPGPDLEPGPFSIPPIAFTRRARLRAAARRFHSGMARDVEARLKETAKGRALVDFASRHRAELTTLLVREGDVRRALIAAVRPVVFGAVTTSELFARRLTGTDLERLERLVREVRRVASPRLKRELAPLWTAYQLIGKKTLARFFGLVQ